MLNLTVSKKELKKVITKVSKGIEKSPLKILSYILIKNEGIGHVSLSTTDLEFGISCTLKAAVQEEGSFCVQGKDLKKIISSIKQDELNFTQEKEYETVVKVNGFKVKTEDTEGFPCLPFSQNIKKIAMKEGLLLNILKNAYISIANEDEQRYYLTGLNIRVEEGKIFFASSNGLSLFKGKEEIETTEGISFNTIIPRKTVKKLISLLSSDDNSNVIIGYDNEGIITFKFENVNILSRVIDCKYPKYKSVIPTSHMLSIKLNRENLITEIEKSLSLNEYNEDNKKDENNDLLNCLRFDIEESEISIKHLTCYYDLSKSTSFCFPIIEKDVVFGNGKLSIAFDSKILLSVLKVIDTEEIEIYIKDPEQPLKIENNGMTHLIMPIRLKKIKVNQNKTS